jgi:hypothetical protein
MTHDSDHPNGVGYGRPPVHGQFKKGTSGNPKGSRRKRETRAEIIARVRDTPITVTVAGKQVTMTKFEAAVQTTYNKTLSGGNPRDLEKLLLLADKFGAPPADERAAEAQAGADAVILKIAKIFERTQGPDTEDYKIMMKRHDEEMQIVTRCPTCMPGLIRLWIRFRATPVFGGSFTYLENEYKEWKAQKTKDIPETNKTIPV